MRDISSSAATPGREPPASMEIEDEKGDLEAGHLDQAANGAWLFTAGTFGIGRRAAADQPDLRGFDGVRAYTQAAELSRPLLEQALAFEPAGDGWEIRGSARGSTYAYDPPPAASGIQGAGTIHHLSLIHI